MGMAADKYLGVSPFRTINNGDPMGTYVGRYSEGNLTMSLGFDQRVFTDELAIVEGAGGSLAAQE